VLSAFWCMAASDFGDKLCSSDDVVAGDVQVDGCDNGCQDNDRADWSETKHVHIHKTTGRSAASN